MTGIVPAYRPQRARELERKVGEFATEHSLPVQRVRRSISFTIIAAILARTKAFDGGPAFMIKGGVAMERRQTDRPRATKDFDTVFRSAGVDLVDALDAAFKLPYDGWQLRRDGEVEPLENGKAQRVNVKLEFEGRGWGTVPLEVSDPEGTPVAPENVPAFDLAQFGLIGPSDLACMPIRRQVAQKLHGMTQPPVESSENRRFRDLLDVWTLRNTIPIDAKLRGECKQVFRLRNTHAWPPTIKVYPSWPDAMKKQASDEGLEFESAELAARDVEALIASIEAIAKQIYAASYGEIAETLAINTDLRDAVFTLIGAEAMPGKVLEGAARETRFREIMLRLAAGDLDLAEATSRTEQYLAPQDSPYRSDRRVFARGWADRLVRTQYSRFYNQAVLETLLAAGEARCFVPHSPTESAESPCSLLLAGKEHDARALLDALIAAYREGRWGESGNKIPDHPHCTHVVVPVGYEAIK